MGKTDRKESGENKLIMANEFIKHINPLGRPPKYDTPEKLWKKFTSYCDWCDNNPIDLPSRMNVEKGSQNDLRKAQKGTVQARRPYVLYGFLVWAGITNWTEFKKRETNQSDDFLRVIRAIEETIKSQQVSGAMVGLYNSNLTARLNGINDATDITTNGKDIVSEPMQIEIIYSKNQVDKEE